MDEPLLVCKCHLLFYCLHIIVGHPLIAIIPFTVIISRSNQMMHRFALHEVVGGSFGVMDLFNVAALQVSRNILIAHIAILPLKGSEFRA